MIPVYFEEISGHCWRFGTENGRWWSGVELSCLLSKRANTFEPQDNTENGMQILILCSLFLCGKYM
jgi:hypothetical protein